MEGRLEFSQNFEEREVSTLLEAQSELQGELTQAQISLQQKAGEIKNLEAEREQAETNYLSALDQLESLQKDAKTEREALLGEISRFVS